MKNKKPELLSPAGNWASLIAAVENGADSVYFGVKGINMRHWADNFDILELPKIMQYLHSNKRKGYLVLNTIVMNSKINKIARILNDAKKAEVDAVILWDMAVFSLAKDMDLPIHLSTQASVANIQALKYYSEMGVQRVILARECTLFDIREIIKQSKEQNIRCEIETFIHGAMCVSVSGRCFLSYHSFGKSANKGQCIQPCRREYLIRESEGEEYIVGKDYILSPKDLCTVDFIHELIESGISSFKIEGRMRSPEYLKVVTSVYREAVDAYFEGQYNESLKSQLKERLSCVYNRGFSTGFFFGKPEDAKSVRNEHFYEKVYMGEVTRFFKKINVAEIKLQSESLNVEDEILFIGKSTPALFTTVKEVQFNNEFVDKAKKGTIVGVKIPFFVKPKDKVFLWRKK